MASGCSSPEPDGPPTLPAFGLADSICAVAASSAITMALYHRDARGGAGHGHEQGGVNPAGEHQGVGDREDRRGVDQHDVVLGLEGAEDLDGALRRQELGGVGGQRPRGQQREPGLVGDLLHGAGQPHLAEQHRGEADLVVQAEELVHPGPAQVAAHDGHRRAGAGQGHGQIRQGGGLALLGA